MTKFLNISTDNTLGGNSPSDVAVSSQKAVKEYVDSQTGTAPAFANITGQPTDNANLASALNAKYDASNPNGYTSNVGTVTSVNNVSPVNGNVSLSIPTVSDTYSATSSNAMSGKAVASAVSGYVPTSRTVNGKALTSNISLSASDVGALPDSTVIPTVNNATLTITQGGTTKGTFTANASSNVTIDLDAGGSVDVDNKSITTNSSDQIQTVGVINSRDTSTAIKTWTGTKAQYDAIVTKDANTLYNITDDTDVSLTILEALYPVGSVYITTANTCPLSTLISGSTWVLVSSGRVLQGADSGHIAGTTIEAGLPNITGEIVPWSGKNTYDLGAFFGASTGALRNVMGATTKILSEQNYSGTGTSYVTFDASSSSSVYGNSTTVQPPAYVVNIYRRTA